MGGKYYLWLRLHCSRQPLCVNGAERKMTAKKTLMSLSSKIATSLPPVPGQEAGVDGRRAATAASFAQLAEIGGDASLTEADAKAGFLRLGIPQEGDTPPVAARRLTCRQVADLLCPTTERAADLLQRQRVALGM